MLLFAETAAARLTQVENETHRFQYIQGDQKIDINLDPAIGKVQYIAVLRLTSRTRFYIQADQGEYLYSDIYHVSEEDVPTLAARCPVDSLTQGTPFLYSSDASPATISKTLSLVEQGVFRVLGSSLITPTWVNLEVSRMSRAEVQGQSYMIINICNPISQPQNTWRIYNRIYSGQYTLLEELSLL